MHIRLIARRTGVLTPLVYAPFLIIALLLIARWDAFDYTTEATGVVILFSFSTLVAIGIVAALRDAAKTVKAKLVKEMRETLDRMQGPARKLPRRQDQLAVLSRLCNEAEAETTGAFQPILEQPVVKALLVLAGSAGIQQLPEVMKWFR